MYPNHIHNQQGCKQIKINLKTSGAKKTHFGMSLPIKEQIYLKIPFFLKKIYDCEKYIFRMHCFDTSYMSEFSGIFKNSFIFIKRPFLYRGI
jgi:hypothetical protein